MRRRLNKHSVTANAIALIAVSSLIAAACGNSTSASSGRAGAGSVKESGYVLGAAYPLSGEAQSVGEDFETGTQAEVNVINEHGGVDGKPLKVYYADNQLTAAGGVSSFDTLASVDHAQAIIQTSSAAVTSSAPIATRSKILMLNPGGEDPDIQSLSPYIISDIPNIGYEINVMLPYLRGLGYKRMVAFSEANALGSLGGVEAEKEWKSLGGQWLGNVLEPITQVDYSSTVAQIEALRPDVIYLITGAAQAGDFIKDARTEGLKVPMAGSSSLQTGGVFPITGSLANGILDSAVSAPLDQASLATKEWEAEYRKLYPKQSIDNIYTIYAAECVQMYVTAAEYLAEHKLGYNGTNLRNAMKAIRVFNVLTGPITVASNGAAGGYVTLYKVDNEAFVPFRTVSTKSSAP